ncbi:hypothetical protein BN1013_02476 [Candidatus Rubidus massiliensis]|nr:hypothetical protein BN1013_02476 [Candidatus Rubidus massiliensis]
MENTSPFYWTKSMDVGTRHPIIARISAGIPRLLDLWEVSKEMKQQVQNYCYDIAIDLIEAEKNSLPVINEIEEIEAKLKVLNPSTLPKSIDSVINIQCTRSFFKFSKAALEKLAVVLGLVFEKKFSKPKFKDIINELAKTFPDSAEEEYLILSILRHYQPFADKLIELRNREEHPHKKGEEFVNNYKVINLDGNLILERPSFIGNIPVLDYLKNAIYLLLHFIEESLVASISLNLHPIVGIYDIPLEKRDPKFPRRFVLCLPGHTLGGNI